MITAEAYAVVSAAHSVEDFDNRALARRYAARLLRALRASVRLWTLVPGRLWYVVDCPDVSVIVQPLHNGSWRVRYRRQ